MNRQDIEKEILKYINDGLLYKTLLEFRKNNASIDLYDSENIKQFNKMVDYYLTTIKRYKGEFVLLWHNASFYEQSIKKYAPSYRRAIKKYKELL